MKVERIGVVGAGTMGAGIAQLACLGGFETRLHDPVADALAAGIDRVREGLAKGVKRSLWSDDDAKAAAGRLTAAPDLGGLAGCELVIEAAPESLELKRELFAALAGACGEETTLATNTSSLSVTAIAAATERPQRVCGMHFFNPPALMRLVEVVATEETAEEVIESALAAARAMGRQPIRTADAIGFVANRCIRPFGLEALRLLGERIAGHEQIDRIVRLGGGFRMGPFELQDLVGIDVNFAVAKSFWEQSFHEPRWQPHPLHARMVAAGRLGRKSGRGWYRYEDGPQRPDDPSPPRPRAGLPQVDLDADWIEAPGLRAVRVEHGTLDVLAPQGDVVGFVAMPSLGEANVVELTRTDATREATAAVAERFFAGLGKHCEWVGDSPGLVLGRILAQLVNEAHFAVEEGIASADDVDTAMRLGFNHPRGPFEWAEAVGPERVIRILDALRSERGGERYRVAPSLRRAAGPGPQARSRPRSAQAPQPSPP